MNYIIIRHGLYLTGRRSLTGSSNDTSVCSPGSAKTSKTQPLEQFPGLR